MSSEHHRNRYMRLFVFFDLPIETAQQRKESGIDVKPGDAVLEISR